MQETNKKREGYEVDGFGQIIEMLRLSDQEFRHKILRNIADRDPALATRLAKACQESIREHATEQEARQRRRSVPQNQQALDRAQRNLRSKSYGN